VDGRRCLRIDLHRGRRRNIERLAEPMNSPQGGQAEPEDRAAARVGATIRGKWHLDALLGVGGMAAVYAASHRNGQRAALKVLHADFARDRIVCERFLREAYVSN